MTWQEACRILELVNPKTLEEVREAYSIQVKAWHPDRFEDDAKMHRIGTAKMKLINEAFKYIKDNWSRRGSFQTPYEFPKAAEPVSRRKAGPSDIVTVLETERPRLRRTRFHWEHGVCTSTSATRRSP